MNKIVDWCPFKSQIIEKVEKEQNNMIGADDRRYVFDSYECLNIFRKLKSVYDSSNRTLFSFFYCNYRKAKVIKSILS